MISTHSDKALLEMARKGSDTAASILLRRWGLSNEVAQVTSAMAKWRKGGSLSTSAAKKIAMGA